MPIVTLMPIEKLDQRLFEFFFADNSDNNLAWTGRHLNADEIFHVVIMINNGHAFAADDL